MTHIEAVMKTIDARLAEIEDEARRLKDARALLTGKPAAAAKPIQQKAKATARPKQRAVKHEEMVEWAMSQQGTFRPVDMRKALGIDNSGTVAYHLRRMVGEGKLKQQGAGMYQRVASAPSLAVA